MKDKALSNLQIRGARENNLQQLSLEIPHQQLIVVTGVSGSGKSSLAFDVIAKEGRRRYLETLPTFSRRFSGKITRPDVDAMEGLPPVITLGQHTGGGNVRSTVGTLSDTYDLLRLLFARLGTTPEGIALSRSLFSFNTSSGACPVCKGLGKEEKISLDKLIVDPVKSLREGVLAPTLPNGYIMYSQVTLDVLDRVCKAHDFSVDIPWNELTAEQQDVVLHGSTRIKVPFGKHSIESRLKWTGITAKPREEGFYRGLMTIMAEILRRDRNANILRYVVSLPCSSCHGHRLREESRSVLLQGKSIVELAQLPLIELKEWLKACNWPTNHAAIAAPVIKKLNTIIDLLSELGVGHLTLSRPAPSLSGSEIQRIRLINQVTSQLSDVLYVFDEPSAGLHPSDHHKLMRILRSLVNNGNTVMVVEHDEATIRQADWIVDIGPKAGRHGGQLLFNGPRQDFLQAANLAEVSPTYQMLQENQEERRAPFQPGRNWITLRPHAVVPDHFPQVRLNHGALNVVTGIAGSGTTTLVHRWLEPAVRAHLEGKREQNEQRPLFDGLDNLDKLITLDASPIGRTPRSNPATYIGLANRIRDLFAKQPAAKEAGFKKGRFSFNNKGGRCEDCQGAGRTQIGMHFLGNVDVLCTTCKGKRFNPETLSIHYQGASIFDVFELTVEEALDFFASEKAILNQLKTLDSVGLGYIQLGQPSTTLSGGEAQRIKLAAQLSATATGNTLYLLDEPTTGLHRADVQVLVQALRKLVEKGNTVICVEQDPGFIQLADWVVNLSESVVIPAPEMVLNSIPTPARQIDLCGVHTHQLKQVDCSIPKGQLTVITGVSGSGKSSLAFDTLYSEGQSRFTESLSAYMRSQLRLANPAQLESSVGLGPVVGINRKALNKSGRSTVGTLTGLYEHIRLLYSRVGQLAGNDLSARHFSFNHQFGACPACDGLGQKLTCDPARLVTSPHLTLAEGMLVGTKPGKFYGDPFGRHVAIFREVARRQGVEVDGLWTAWSEKAKTLALYGTGEEEYTVLWEFKNKTRSGQQEVKAPWLGFCNYIDEEYQRKHQNKNISGLLAVMHAVPCPVCLGKRLRPEVLAVHFQDRSIHDLSGLPLTELATFFREIPVAELTPAEQGIVEEIGVPVLESLGILQDLGLGYLTLNRRADSLSGGEGQRLRLAGQFASNLFGVTYVLDEPTIGLHEKDAVPLIGILRKLIAKGNTVVVVEHDLAMIEAADHLIEMGPGAGQYGGEVVYAGKPEGIVTESLSPTGQYLANPYVVEPIEREGKGIPFGVKGAAVHNLKNIDVSFQSGQVIAVTGVSGSGKSTLVREVVYASLREAKPIGCDAVYGQEAFDQLFFVDQEPIGTNSLSTPATYSGLMDALRTLFAKSEDAKALGFKKSAFSYVHKEGKCPACGGFGQEKTAMDFMSDVWTPCDSCAGARYRPEVLQVKVAGKTIAEVLEMSAQDALTLFEDEKRIQPYLAAFVAVGLGYLTLGQAAPTLSGGEAQRMKLAQALIHPDGGKHLYLFDEPSTGLHFQDLKKLIDLFNQLADQGHTILFIEHHPLLIQMANQVVELGPVGGPEGGYLISG